MPYPAVHLKIAIWRTERTLVYVDRRRAIQHEFAVRKAEIVQKACTGGVHVERMSAEIKIDRGVAAIDESKSRSRLEIGVAKQLQFRHLRPAGRNISAAIGKRTAVKDVKTRVGSITIILRIVFVTIHVKHRAFAHHHATVGRIARIAVLPRSHNAVGDDCAAGVRLAGLRGDEASRAALDKREVAGKRNRAVLRIAACNVYDKQSGVVGIGRVVGNCSRSGKSVHGKRMPREVERHA